MTDDNKKETSLIPIGSTSLVRAGNAIGITKKLLAEIDPKKISLAQLKGQLKWKFKAEGMVFFAQKQKRMPLQSFTQRL